MAKTLSKHRAAWTGADVKQLRSLAKQNTPTRLISVKMGRTVTAVRAKAALLDISLKPANQSPYG